MIEKYYSFDTVKMLKEFNENKTLLSTMKIRLKNMNGNEKIKLETEIMRLENDLNFVEACIKLLTDEEATAIHEFFISGKKSAESLNELSISLNAEKTYIYDLRKRALKRLTAFVSGINN